MRKKIAALLMCYAVLVLPTVAGGNEPTPHLIEPGHLVEQSYIAYTLDGHDLLWANLQADEDLIERLRREIVGLKAVTAHAQAEKDLHGTELKKAWVQADIYKLQIPGFWRRNFGQCFWAGTVVGYAANELVSNP